jgi:penicillin amidase
MLLGWDGVLARDSAAAALYEVWQYKLSERVLKFQVPEDLWNTYSNRFSLMAALDRIEQPAAPQFGHSPVGGRDLQVVLALRDAVTELRKRVGPDPAEWQWGNLHRAHLKHMLATEEVEGRELRVEGQKDQFADRAAIAAVFNLAPVPRDGDGNTPLAAGGPRPGVFDQTTGASYRHVIDLANWDRSLATSTPGQSGQPGSPHYGDLLPLWADGKYFPLLYTREAVETATTDRLVLLPDSFK